ncbi:halocyanin domain-containing protein [Halomarina litorea]|uniref:halocyanin domain-containing protein n=1 Tax=Halomarina litorea TaxID=2961595 RepID=UPI0020C1BC4D|nr:halocyanin domain-containing protein [Halomarina sp. BCD28]
MTVTTSTRRQFLATTAGTAVGASVLTDSVGAQSGGVDLSEWFANTDGVSEVVDKRGESQVVVEVGAQGNGGAVAFAPAAVRVDPGTTVVWEWTGDGGTHNVVAKDGSFESEYQNAAGATFEYTPESTGVLRYVCAPHEAMGMKGALLVGDVAVSLGAGTQPTPESEPTETFDGWLEGTDNYDGVVDARGQDRVTVEVGAEGNGGQFAFAPAAVRVDPGTTVVWEWVGDKRYDVVDTDLEFRSEAVSGAGHRFAVEFDGRGWSTYECSEYGHLGMRGVIVVGDGPDAVISRTGLAVGGGLTAVLFAPMFYALGLHIRDTTRSDSGPE